MAKSMHDRPIAGRNDDLVPSERNLPPRHLADTSAQRVILHILCIRNHTCGIARELKTMNIISTIKANWRDILAFILVGLGIACIGGVLDYIAAWGADGGFLALVIPTISNYIQGFSRFIGASITATLLWMLLWPRVSSTANKSFNTAFEALPANHQLVVYLALIIGGLIAAAICFS